MTSGFGVDPAVDGSSGTSSSDIRKIFGGLYSPGIINGCAVTTSASAMQYSVAAGVVAIRTATDEIVLAPVATTTVPTTSAPVSGTRIDVVYAQQRFPSIEGDANIVIGVASVAPERSVILKKVIVSAGQTSTNAAVPTGAVDFSIPYGATLGRLHYYQYQASHLFQPDLQRFGHGTISLPTDRLLRFSVHIDISSDGANGFDNSKYCEYGFLPNVDNADFILWTTGGLHQAWQSIQFSTDTIVGAGIHTVNLGAKRMAGPGTGLLHYGIDYAGFGRRGMEFYIDDIGPAL